MNSDIFCGGIPALMTPCNADRTPNTAALVKKGLELITAGMNEREFSIYEGQSQQQG